MPNMMMPMPAGPKQTQCQSGQTKFPNASSQRSLRYLEPFRHARAIPTKVTMTLNDLIRFEIARGTKTREPFEQQIH